MKALTLHQPWATLILREAKRWETRAWTTKYRGPLAIHAGQKEPHECRNIEPFATELRGVELPTGAFLCVVRLLDVISTEAALTMFAIEGANEESYGNFSFGRYAWRLSAPTAIFSPPIEYRGAQGLWNVPDDVLGLG